MKILIYGGAFNPVHSAHIKNIELACNKIAFDKIIIIPNKFCHFKNNDELASIEDRLEMLDLALSQLKDLNIDIEISKIEIDSEDRLYTNDVIDILKEEVKNAELYFLIGSDQAVQLDKWYKITELKQKVQFIVTKRDNTVFDETDLIVIENEPMPYSSTKIRHHYADSGIESINKYIRYYGLYLKLVIRNYMGLHRATHSHNVALLAKEKATLYNIDENKAYVAGMIHDIGKEVPLEEQYKLIECDKELFEVNDATVHAFSAYHIAKDELKIDDEEILCAIKWHTTAYFEMPKLAKLIYVCDMLSSERDFTGIAELRALLDVDLDECYKQCFLASYRHLECKHISISRNLKKLKEKIERNDF